MRPTSLIVLVLSMSPLFVIKNVARLCPVDISAQSRAPMIAYVCHAQRLKRNRGLEMCLPPKEPEQSD